MNRLKEKYQTEILPALKSEFKMLNNLAVPKLQKVVINVGASQAKDNQAVLDKVVLDITNLSGQKPVVTKAKSSISGFKLGKGQSIGVMVTLRGARMYEFLDKLISIVLPKVRDFRGLSRKSFDSQGNYTLGIRELNIFPEVTFQTSTLKGSRGLEVSIVSSSKSQLQGTRLLELLGMPFKAEE